ncbi:MAG: hypothetical protein M3020_18860, partial [Myxococcota bacterium]|nr:hypothetical protein [Myxococcota bacterium]
MKNAFIGYVPKPSRSALRWLCSLLAASAFAAACGNEAVDDLFTSTDPSRGGSAPIVGPEPTGTGGGPFVFPNLPATGV